MKLLSFFKIGTIILYLLRYLANVTPAQWDSAVKLVLEAESKAESGTRAQWVSDKLKALYPILATSTINWLIETALKYVRNFS